MSYTVRYNGITDKAVGCHASSRPSIPAPKRDTSVIKIPGRDASYYDTDYIYSDIVIPVDFSFLERDKSKWGEQYRKVKHWILAQGDGELRFSDDEDVHYRVLSTAITSTERIARTIGVIKAEFVCEGYTYLNSGDAYVQLSATVDNDYDTCHPIYRIAGHGQCTLTVNDNAFVLDINGSVTVDSDKFYSYSSSTGSFVNTSVTGDYQDLWLIPGQNTMTITSGFTCEFMPQWRCL